MLHNLNSIFQNHCKKRLHDFLTDDCGNLQLLEGLSKSNCSISLLCARAGLGTPVTRAPTGGREELSRTADVIPQQCIHARCKFLCYMKLVIEVIFLFLFVL